MKQSGKERDVTTAGYCQEIQRYSEYRTSKHSLEVSQGTSPHKRKNCLKIVSQSTYRVKKHKNRYKGLATEGKLQLKNSRWSCRVAKLRCRSTGLSMAVWAWNLRSFPNQTSLWFYGSCWFSFHKHFLSPFFVERVCKQIINPTNCVKYTSQINHTGIFSFKSNFITKLNQKISLPHLCKGVRHQQWLLQPDLNRADHNKRKEFSTHL